MEDKESRAIQPNNQVNIYQGPISRHLRLGKLSIQTAGFSGTGSHGGKVAEAEIFGIKNFEEVKDIVMKFVKGMKPEAVEAEAEAKPSKDMNQQILAELRKDKESRREIEWCIL